MYRTLFTLLLLAVSGISMAGTLKIGDNVNVLAVRDAKIDLLSKSITFGAGEQAMIVRFDAPTNPGSANESQGRVTSDAWLLTFTPPLTGNFSLSTADPRTETDARKAAQHPQFALQNADGSSITLKKQHLDLPQSSLLTNYEDYLPASALAAQTSVIASQAPAAAKQTTAADKTTQTGSLSSVQSEFLKLDASQRKAFLRWALEL
ncbi:DUF2057 domain-containing protein [Enterobacteriaceae bacterium H11S18]|uniref:DUF2057 family protein n=1 Tax=Dryocola clanedunensis TaxID=2925396 RepID=UPI0022F0A904|nr:DUF2057 family protein [Dryocola clanedunensis]MCT4711882.1 DUF2057 domain-containing protein [Dryocola clanedunensis]